MEDNGRQRKLRREEKRREEEKGNDGILIKNI